MGTRKILGGLKVTYQTFEVIVVPSLLWGFTSKKASRFANFGVATGVCDKHIHAM